MKPYTALLRMRFMALLQYRAAAAAGLFTQLFWGLIRVMIFEAFFATSLHPERIPISRAQIVSYIWLGQAMLGLLPWNIDREMKEKIRTGGVAYDLMRPVDIYFQWFFQAMATRTAPTLLKSIPLIITAVLFFGLRPPPSIASLAAWLLFTLLALLLNCAFQCLISVSMMWTVSGEGISRIAPPVVYACSGMMVPLPLMPQVVQPLLNALPFRIMVDVPFRIYSGQLPANAITLVPLILHAVIWTAALLLTGRLLMQRGLKMLTVQGG